MSTDPPPIGVGYRVFRRTLDITVGATALALALPLMLAVAGLVKATGPGPIFYRHTRVGRGGELFGVWKFRTMRNGTDAEVLADPDIHATYVANGFKLAGDDPRITRVGRWLRRTSCDELPQLVNVLRGQMSVVGVRPVEAAQFDELPIEDQALYRRLPPGMTGLWQVRGRSSLSPADRLALDRQYLTRPSAALDVSILARTPAAVLRTNEAQ